MFQANKEMFEAAVCNIRLSVRSQQHLYTMLNIQKIEHLLGMHIEKSAICWRCHSYFYDPEIEGEIFK